MGERISATAHCEQLLRLLLGVRLYTANTCTASTLIGYIEQARLAMSGNGASGSFGTGPASGYFLNFMFMFIVFVTSTLDHALNFIYKNVMIYALIFGIKMNRNWPLIPTIQKLDRAFSVSGFAAHLKPNPFDGTNYKRWVRKLEL